VDWRAGALPARVVLVVRTDPDAAPPPGACAFHAGGAVRVTAGAHAVVFEGDAGVRVEASSA
jgi:hypothetical protein